MSDEGADYSDKRGHSAPSPTADKATATTADRSANSDPARQLRKRSRWRLDTSTPIPLARHAASDPLASGLFIAAPWIFGFHDVSQAKNASIVIGIAILLTAIMIRWRMSIIKLIPLAVHRAIDLILATTAIASPYLRGFDDVGSATHFLLIIGIAQLDITILTRWDPADDFAADPAPRNPAPPTS